MMGSMSLAAGKMGSVNLAAGKIEKASQELRNDARGSENMVQNQESAAQEPEKTKRGLSGSAIKIIALTAMLIDHVAAALFVRLLIGRGLYEIQYADIERQISWLTENAALYYGYEIMRMIGRLGFPIFCFLLVEGFQKTRSRKKYAFRLGLFALLSEVPFDLVFSGRVLEFGYQNVYFTLLLGMLALCAVDWVAEHELSPALGWLFTVTGILAPAGYVFQMVQNGTFYNAHFSKQSALVCAGVIVAVTLIVLLLIGFLSSRAKEGRLSYIQKLCAKITVVVAAMLFADFLRTDYSGLGVMTIAAMYFFRRRKTVSMLAGCIVLTIMSVGELPSFFTLVPVALYNGRRGLKMKYFFYAFYPVHLFLIWLIALAMGMGWIPVV